MEKKPSCAFAQRMMIVVLVAAHILLAGCQLGDEKTLADSTGATISQPMASIATVHVTLEFPEVLAPSLRHEEVTEGNIVMEIFYMLHDGSERELYRIYFGDPQMGSLLGYLNTETAEIPVTCSTNIYEDTEFGTEEERKLYNELMDGFSVLVRSIYNDPRFSEQRRVAPVGEQKISLRHWTVTIPDNVRYTELEENGIYRVDFFGEVSGERIALYTISLGATEAESTLGYYTVDGDQQPVTVETCSLEPYAGWPEEDQAVIYRMMESVNAVVQVITADKNFAEYPESA